MYYFINLLMLNRNEPLAQGSAFSETLANLTLTLFNYALDLCKSFKRGTSECGRVHMKCQFLNN